MDQLAGQGRRAKVRLVDHRYEPSPKGGHLLYEGHYMSGSVTGRIANISDRTIGHCTVHARAYGIFGKKGWKSYAVVGELLPGEEAAFSVPVGPECRTYAITRIKTYATEASDNSRNVVATGDNDHRALATTDEIDQAIADQKWRARLARLLRRLAIGEDSADVRNTAIDEVQRGLL